VNDRELRNTLGILLRVGAVAKDSKTTYVVGDQAMADKLRSSTTSRPKNFDATMVADFRRNLAELGYEFR